MPTLTAAHARAVAAAGTGEPEEPSLDKPLSSDERKRFAELEKIVEEDMAQFLAVGCALSEIYYRRLYREEYSTFEKYCREKWSFGSARAWQLIQRKPAATVS